MFKLISQIRGYYVLENIQNPTPESLQNNVQNKNKVHSLKNVLYASNSVVSMV